MESKGQSSCRGQEDGDGSERPLKKARFAWQVKGKHHPKNETTPVITSSSGEIQDSASSSIVREHVANKTNSCESRNSVLQGYVKNDDRNTDMARGNSSTINSSSSRSQNYSCDRSLDVINTCTLNPFRIASQSLSYIENSLEDQYLLQWQTQQMVACCIDNTINSITDRRMQAPSTTGASLRALNMAQFLNHLPGDNTIENEGILMAISAHGLRNNTSVTHCDDSDDYDENEDSNIPIFPSIYQDPIVTNQVPTPNPEPPIEDNDDVGFFDDLSGSPEDDNHFQFMNAAVQFAISSKGLTASGT